MNHAPPASTTPGSPRLWRLLRSYWWRERWAALGAYVATAIAIGCLAITPWPLQAIIDNVIGGQPLPPSVRSLVAALSTHQLIGVLAAVAAAVAVLGAAAGALEKNLNAVVRERLTLRLRDDMIAHLQTLAATFAPSARNGELALRVVDDVQQVVRLVTKTLPLIVRHLGVGCVLLAIMIALDPRLAGLGVVLIVTLAAITRWYARPLQRAAHDKRHQEGAVAGLAQEIMRGLPNVQSGATDDHIRRAFRALNVQSLRAGVEENRVAVALERTMQIAHGIALAIVTGAGATLVIGDQLSVGELTVFMSYMNQLFKPVDKINELASNTTRALVRATRLQELLARAPLVQDPPAPVPLPAPRGVLTLHDVAFAYPAQPDGHGGVTLFQHVNCTFGPGRLHVIVGASGSGKSTLFRLLCRVFDPVAGELRFDGIPFRSLALRDLRQQIAVVYQQTHLFAGTLRAALLPADSGATPADIHAALAQVSLSAFVEALPQGLDTPLGEDGFNLSGGQRTRIAIARAILTACPVVLLDEPLANVDTDSQRVIVEAILHLARTRTCIAISHQPLLAARADSVLELAARQLRSTVVDTAPVVPLHPALS